MLLYLLGQRAGSYYGTGTGNFFKCSSLIVFFVQTVEMVDKLGGVLGDLQELVEQVYHFKDHYFEEHDLEEAAAKCDKAA